MGHQCHVMSGWPKGFKGATAQHDSFGWVQGHEESPNVSWLMEFQHIYINQSNICQNISEGCGRMLDYSTFLNMFRSEKRRFTDWSARSRVRSSSWSLVSKDVARPDLSPRSSYTIKEARKHKDLWNECEMSKIYPSSKQHLFNLHIFALNWNRNITLSALLQRWNLFNQRNNKNIRWVVAERRLNNSWTIIIITFYNII